MPLASPSRSPSRSSSRPHAPPPRPDHRVPERHLLNPSSPRAAKTRSRLTQPSAVHFWVLRSRLISRLRGGGVSNVHGVQQPGARAPRLSELARVRPPLPPPFRLSHHHHHHLVHSRQVCCCSHKCGGSSLLLCTGGRRGPRAASAHSEHAHSEHAHRAPASSTRSEHPTDPAPSTERLEATSSKTRHAANGHTSAAHLTTLFSPPSSPELTAVSHRGASLCLLRAARQRRCVDGAIVGACRCTSNMTSCPQFVGPSRCARRPSGRRRRLRPARRRSTRRSVGTRRSTRRRSHPPPHPPPPPSAAAPLAAAALAAPIHRRSHPLPQHSTPLPPATAPSTRGKAAGVTRPARSAMHLRSDA